ncbi:MAG: cation diffusion facilitator family transporter [Gammaproteobacteria bacterium]|nr:cation diffusion facilitator family transporter [Gammaproteobacteria bacterium]NNJ49394.1 cation transporter [Gammaproteobacteria bacterium]
MEISIEQRKKETNRITLWGVAVNLFLAVIKTVGGIMGQSQALLADGIHSLSDLASDAMVLVAAKHAGEDADEDHPYGHGRYETLATVALGILLMGVAGGIAYDAILRLENPEDIAIPASFTLIIAAISILSNEALYHATRAVAHKIRSPLLEANAWHHRSDAVSSIVVLFGIGATFIGYPLVDAIAAIIVALMIGKIGLDLSRQSVQELVDTALEPEMVEQIKNTILDIDDVRELHLLRSRRMGHNALVDVHIQVSPKLSVSEGHHISESVETALIEKFDEVNDVTVHIDPEDDESAASCKNLPLRSELLLALNQEWSKHETLKNIDDITLHYLDGHISVEAGLPYKFLNKIEDVPSLQKEFYEATKQVGSVGECKLQFY